MDERAINGAAIAAINDLQLDCEIKEVCPSPGGDEWCVKFSGNYGHFCDSFKNQFDEESSPEVMREKIKGYLIKQVNKLRSTTGRRRRSIVAEESENRESESGILAAPLKFAGELFDRAVGLAGGVMSQASSVAETARDAVADVAANISPVTIEVRSTTREVKKRASGSSARKSVKATRRAAPKTAKKATKKAAKRTTKRVSRKAGKKAAKKAKKARQASKKSK